MPTYEYGCAKGHTFERIQKMNDKPVAKCPVCGAKSSRIISGGQGLIFKGTGFYITDYGKDGKGARKDPDGSSGSEAKTESKGESGSEPKREAKSDAKPGDSAAKKESKSEAKPTSAPKPGKPDAP
jgi:putative FmdB family regulatory protein